MRQTASGCEPCVTFSSPRAGFGIVVVVLIGVVLALVLGHGP